MATLIPTKAASKRLCLSGSTCAIVLILASNQLIAENRPDQTPDDTIIAPRFVVPESGQRIFKDSAAGCIYDSSSGLTWEVKSDQTGLRNARQTYSWYQPNMKLNGGFPGYRGRGNCELASCDTQTYITKINELKLCGHSNWRLPTREELRSLIDYSITYPGPMIDQNAFPNTQSQFYWSATPDASEKDSAWGIGFSFGYDYAYFKSDHGYVRLVSGPNQ